MAQLGAHALNPLFTVPSEPSKPFTERYSWLLPTVVAVVDQFGRVHGLEGLRVVDASIMPDCIRANTNVTTIMIGERIADFMRQGS